MKTLPKMPTESVALLQVLGKPRDGSPLHCYKT